MCVAFRHPTLLLNSEFTVRKQNKFMAWQGKGQRVPQPPSPSPSPSPSVCAVSNLSVVFHRPISLSRRVRSVEYLGMKVVSQRKQYAIYGNSELSTYQALRNLCCKAVDGSAVKLQAEVDGVEYVAWHNLIRDMPGIIVDTIRGSSGIRKLT